jgi:hypothetical protein
MKNKIALTLLSTLKNGTFAKTVANITNKKQAAKPIK